MLASKSNNKFDLNLYVFGIGEREIYVIKNIAYLNKNLKKNIYLYIYLF